MYIFSKYPLHEAAFEGNKEIVKLLIAHGADVNVQDNHGETPLQEAAFIRRDIVELLKKHGAK